MNVDQPTVARFMTVAPVSADQGLRLVDANERMFLNNIRHLVVHDGGHVVGVLSTRDVALALSLAKEPASLTVRDAMVEAPYTCAPNTPLADVVLEMEKHRYGCAIVVDGPELLGIFTTTDALRAVRALITCHEVEPVTKPTHSGADDEHTTHVGRRVRVRRIASLEGTYLLGHRVG